MFWIFHSRYIQRLPLMFIFGIATSPSTIQHMLLYSVSSLLCIQLFQSLSCTQHLTTVMNKVLSHPMPKSRVKITLNFNIGKILELYPKYAEEIYFLFPADPDAVFSLQTQWKSDAGADEHVPLSRLLRQEFHQGPAGEGRR